MFGNQVVQTIWLPTIWIKNCHKFIIQMFVIQIPTILQIIHQILSTLDVQTFCACQKVSYTE